MSLTQRIYRQDELDVSAEESVAPVVPWRVRRVQMDPALLWAVGLSVVAHLVFVLALGPNTGRSALPYEPNVLRYDHLPAIALGEIDEGWMNAGGQDEEAAPAALDAPEGEEPPAADAAVEEEPEDREQPERAEPTPRDEPEQDENADAEQHEDRAQPADNALEVDDDDAVAAVEEASEDRASQPTEELPQGSEVAALQPTDDEEGAVAPGAIRREGASGRGGANEEAESESASGRGNAAPGVAVGQPEGDLNGLRREHRDRLSRAISAQNICSREMLRDGLRGVVELGLRQDADGELARVRVLRSRGGEAIEEAAIAYVRGLRRLPQPDARIVGDEFRLPVVINCAR